MSEKQQRNMDFYDLDLNDLVLDALDDMNFTDTTPIQEHAIPPILAGRDIVGVAQTGTGKTAAYLLPVLSKLQDGGYPHDAINCIVMAPTRELAQQIDQALQGFSYYLDVSNLAVYGGNDGIRYEQEKRAMQEGADIIIATPGRLISHLSLGNVDLSKVSFFILDEADRMLDMGFIDDILQIEKALPKDRQTIMFSATMPQKIQELANTILRNPVEVKLAVSKPADGIHQMAYICYETQKLGIIKNLFKWDAGSDVVRSGLEEYCGRFIRVQQSRRIFDHVRIDASADPMIMRLPGLHVLLKRVPEADIAGAVENDTAFCYGIAFLDQGDNLFVDLRISPLITQGTRIDSLAELPHFR